MQTQNYLTAGLMTMLLIGILSTSGCIGGQTSPITTGDGDGTLPGITTPGTPTPGIPTNGGAKDTGAGLPLTDQASTTEPVTRYPGSVMLYQSTMVLPEEGDYRTITYGTTVSIDTVETWYRDMLENSGWEFAMEFSDQGTKSITYIKEDTQESVYIDISTLENEYTSIIVIYMKKE